ncbi:unnamed protein product [Caenorhabditis nigoni]
MELSSEFIKENQHFLRSCILYEVLQKKPISHSYQNFCNTVGQDIMNYPDFGFWYYRFYHGNRDLHYDRSADPEPKTIMDMPVKLMHKIAGNLDPIERTRLRYMNHAIKTVADSFPPVFQKIEISISDDDMHWALDNKQYMCFKIGNGCEMYKPNSSKAEKSEKCYMKNGLELLALVQKMPNFQVNHVSVEVYDDTPNHVDLLPVPFNAKSAYIYGHNTHQVVQSLAAMNPGHLESISLKMMYPRERETYGMIFETDQFKQAKNAEFNVEDLVHFSHLKSFKCALTSEDTFEDVPRIRDIISTFETLES